MQHNLYERYTSTSSLAGVDERATLEWSRGYFRAHYSNLLPRDLNAKILEVGCGYGRYIKTLSDMGYVNCYGIDLSHQQISHAKTALRLLNVEQSDALEWLNGKEAMYDCILGLDILEHLQINELISLGEKIKKALKPGGHAIFQIPNSMSPLNPITYGDLTHVRAFTPQSMQQFFLHVGLVPVAYREIPPYIHGIKSAIKRILWIAILKPAISIFVRMMHGKTVGHNIYSSNFIAVATVNVPADDRPRSTAAYPDPGS